MKKKRCAFSTQSLFDSIRSTPLCSASRLRTYDGAHGHAGRTLGPSARSSSTPLPAHRAQGESPHGSRRATPLVNLLEYESSEARARQRRYGQLPAAIALAFDRITLRPTLMVPVLDSD